MAGFDATALTTVVSSGSAVTDNDISAVSAEFTNATGLKVLAQVELTFTFTVSPSDTIPLLNVYKSTRLDGTNYDDAVVTGGVGDEHRLLFSCRPDASTSAQRYVSPKFMLDYEHMKFQVDNITGQTLPAGWTLKVLTSNIVG